MQLWYLKPKLLCPLANLAKIWLNLNYKVWVITMIFLLGNFMVFAQKVKKPKKEVDSVFIQREAEFAIDSSRFAEEKIYLNRHPQDTEIGKFTIEDDKGIYKISFGGFVKLTAYGDAGLEEQQFFDMYNIPTGEINPKGRFNLRVGESRINTEIIGNTSLGTVRLFLEGDFLGSGTAEYLRLRHAYVQYAGFTFGKTWSTWMDLEATPIGIDLTGTNAAVFARNALVRYEFHPKKNLMVNLAVESPQINISEGSTDSLEFRPQLFPDMVVALKKRFGSGHLQIGGILRSILLENTFTKEQKNEIGYGLMVSTAINLGEDWKLLAQVTTGKGVLRYLSSPFDIFPDRNGNLQIPRSESGLLGVEKRINYRSVFTAYYSQVFIPKAFDLSPELFRRGRQVNASYLYDVLPNLRTGMEVIYGTKESVEGAKGDALRIYAMALLSF